MSRAQAVAIAALLVLPACTDSRTVEDGGPNSGIDGEVQDPALHDAAVTMVDARVGDGGGDTPARRDDGGSESNSDRGDSAVDAATDDDAESSTDTETCAPVDDGNSCTDDVCSDGSPAHSVRKDGSKCSDGDACTQSDTCQSGICKGEKQTCDADQTCVWGTCIGAACTGAIGLPGPSQTRVGNHPPSIAAGDLDGDGHVDLVLVNSHGNNVSVLLGRGDATFSPREDYALGTNPQSVALADLNGDDHLDIAVVYSCDIAPDVSSICFSVSVLRNNGDGTFDPAVEHEVGSGSLLPSVAAADLNDDGLTDLVVTGRVMLNAGNGTFAGSLDVGASSAVTIADFDGNDELDLASVGNNLVSLSMGQGDGLFADSDSYASGSIVSSVTSGDLNGDDRPDLVVARFQEMGIDVLRNLGGGKFQERTFYSTNTAGYYSAVVDLDGDGAPEVVVSGDGDFGGVPGVVVLMNDGDGGLAGPVHYAAGPSPDSFAVADFNEDGKPDIGVAGFADDNLTILLGRGDGTLVDAVGYTTGHAPRASAVADLNTDGWVDIAVPGRDSDDIEILINQHDGTFENVASFASAGGPRAIVAADLNGDHLPDLAVASGAGNDVGVVLNVGGGFGPMVHYPAGQTPQAITALDANGDGRVDLAVANSASNVVSVLINSGGLVLFDYAMSYPVGTTPSAIGAGDFDNDGHVDLAVANKASNDVSVLRGRGDHDGRFSPAIQYPAGTAPGVLAIAELNGDEKPDLIVASDSGLGVSVMLNRGGGNFGSSTLYAFSQAMSVVAADLNRDGKPDLGVIDGASAVVLANQGDGTFELGGAYPAGPSPVFAVAADLDNDGITDLVVSNPYNDLISVLLNRCL